MLHGLSCRHNSSACALGNSQSRCDIPQDRSDCPTDWELLVVYGQSGKIALQLLMSYGSGQYSPTMEEYTMHCTMSFSRLSMALILGVWLCTQFTLPALAQDRVRAKVGIQVRSGERTAPAKTTETVKTGDS